MKLPYELEKEEEFYRPIDGGPFGNQGLSKCFCLSLANIDII